MYYTILYIFIIFCRTIERRRSYSDVFAYICFVLVFFYLALVDYSLHFSVEMWFPFLFAGCSQKQQQSLMQHNFLHDLGWYLVYFYAISPPKFIALIYYVTQELWGVFLCWVNYFAKNLPEIKKFDKKIQKSWW